MGRPEEYESLQRKDVRKAFRRAYDEIELAQETLRGRSPDNLLLGLISLNSNRQGLKFGDNFSAIVMEHSDFPESAGWYFALGRYVDLLTNELTDPRFM